jgi:hypothetical protein
MNFTPEFVFKKGGNKKEWSTLQSKINQKLKHENILYILDPAEVARRKTPPSPVINLPPPMQYLETPQEKKICAREQANIDEDRKEKKKDFDRWQEKFAVDFAKGMDCIYQLVSQTIITELDRTLEQLIPVTLDLEIQFFKIFRRLEDKWGPTSKNDAVEIVRLIHALQGDFPGWDTYLVGLDSLVETLTKTPVRDAANNPMFIPVPNRPHLPRPHPHSTLAEYRAHFAADAAAQVAWERQHPTDKIMNHRPTDEAIKEIVIIALAESQFTPYSTLP